MLDFTQMVFQINLVNMEILIALIIFIPVLDAAAVQRFRGHIGEELSIQCFSNWTLNGSYDQYSVYFCKGPCSTDNLLVEKTGSAIGQRGRYRLDSNSTMFSLTIKGLRRTDAGRYFCEQDRNGTVQSQELIVTVLEGTTVPFELGPFTTTEQTVALPQDFTDTTWPSAGQTPLPTSGRSNKKATTSLTDTTVVIIVSVSLALLVCAIIPLIFYSHWRSPGENQDTAEAKTEVDYSEHTDIPLAQTAVALQTDDTDIEAPDAAQYASIYQALDPQTLD